MCNFKNISDVLLAVFLVWLNTKALVISPRSASGLPITMAWST